MAVTWQNNICHCLDVLDFGTLKQIDWETLAFFQFRLKKCLKVWKQYNWLDEVLSKIKPAVHHDDDDWNARVFQHICIQKSKWSSGQTTDTSPWLFVLHMFLLKIQQSTRIRCKNSSRGRNVSVKNGEAVFNKWWKDNAIVDRQESRPLPALPFQDDPASTSCKVDFWPSALKCWWSSDVCYQDEGYKFSGLGHSSLF